MHLISTPDRVLIRTNGRSRRYVRVELCAPAAPRRKDRLPVNLGLVLDRSGSMAGGKLEMARAAAVRAIQTLREEDRFAVVAYDSEVEVALASCFATPEARTMAERTIAGLTPRDSTDLCAGWLAGCEEIGRALAAEAVGRCLLLTDGLANFGVTDHEEIVRSVAAQRQRRVSTTTFGVGADFDEKLLRRMAEAGGGNFYFIETAAQIPDFLAGEVGDLLEVTVPGAALVIEAGAGVVIESLNDFPCRREGGAWRIELGALLSGQVLDPLLVVTFPPGVVGASHEMRISVVDGSRELMAGSPVVFRHATSAENDAQPRERLVDRRVAFVYAAKAAREALELNRDGDYLGAERALRACHRRIARYAGDDLELCALLHELDEKCRRFAQPMHSMMRKMAYSTENASLKSRSTHPRSTSR